VTRRPAAIGILVVSLLGGGIYAEQGAPSVPTAASPQAPTTPPQGPTPAPPAAAAAPDVSSGAAAPAPAAPPARSGAQQPAFRAGVDIVSLNITVTDQQNHYVTDLDLNDFAVFEDGVKQDVTFFNRRQQPIALSLLLDSSASMEDKLPTLQTAAGNFIRRLRPNDLAQVIDFDSRVEIRQAFTGNHEELETAIQQTTAGGSTSLHNAIYIALKELKKIKAVSEEDVRRQALVVFSDGEDTSSLVSFDEVLDLAKRSETAIYTIALRGADTQTKGFREAEFVMRTLAQETGGRPFFPAKVEDLNGVYTQIADELASQYTLGYSSKNVRRDGAYRRIVVQVARPGVTPRAKRGYYAPTSR
jgi:Ca-activated chloride channel family protein